MFKLINKYFIKVVAAAYFGLLIMIITQFPVNFIFDSSQQKIRDILYSVLCEIGTMAFLFYLCKKEGYRENQSKNQLPFKKIILIMCIAVAIYDLLTVIFRYRTLGAATNVCNVAELLGKIPQNEADLTTMARLHGGWMFLSLIIQTIPFVPAMIAGYLSGEKKRRKDRKKLMGEKM